MSFANATLRVRFRHGRFIAACLALSMLSACAMEANRGAMTAALAPDQITADITAIKSSIHVGTISGGETTNPLWTSQVSDVNFKAALEDSLALAVLKGDDTAPYVLNAKLVSLHQPFAGFDMTVTSTVDYTLQPVGGGKPLLDETVVTPYTAAFGDALVAAERLRLANEGAMRENIKEIIARLIKAAQPGGVLSKSAAVKTSSVQ